ncbi:MAG: hypothetical protein EOP21_15055 [Hyphomicrobiales bacterium]|nr:MAG: hypothetical protein EOP21_15055 [Hyphomicrobiales bacterium]
MDTGLIFDEDGVSVDRSFVRIGTMSVKVAEITKVQTGSYRTDGHVAPVCWFFVVLIFLLWMTAPSQNTFTLPTLGGIAAFALYKQFNPKPTRHKVVLGTGSFLNTPVMDTIDEDQANRLSEAIENVMLAV